MIQILIAATDNDYAAAGLLFREYAASINISLDFQHFEKELKELKKMYGPPHGGIVLASSGKEIIGCIGIRKIADQVGELKRMYIKPTHQNRGIGKKLLMMVLEIAAKSNYKVVKLDTLKVMVAAMHLYKEAGFYEIQAYYNNPIPTAVYFEKLL
ncbi:MAG: GNAT family N-acetyltransferase [Ferruginibacter sp.]